MTGLLWVWAVVLAALLQTIRNLAQVRLVASAGMLAGTQVRFVFGFPFALVFLALVYFPGPWPGWPSGVMLGWIALGAATQVAATMIMLAAMRGHGFALAVSLTKTETLQIALLSAWVLGEPLAPGGMAGIVLASVGVVVVAGWPKGAASARERWLAVALGLASASLFAVSGLGYRAAMLALADSTVLERAALGLAWCMGIQAVLLCGYMLLRRPDVLRASLLQWRPSLLAGGSGALATYCWFIGFAMANAADVRAVGLVEVLLAQYVAHRYLRQPCQLRELAGMALLLGGVLVLLLTAR